MTSKRKTISQRVDDLHTCIDKFKTETKVNFVRLETRLDNTDKNFDDYRKESKESRRQVYDTLTEIKSTLAADHAVDEERHKANVATTPSKSESPILEAIRKRAITVLSIVGTVAVTVLIVAVVNPVCNGCLTNLLQ